MKGIIDVRPEDWPMDVWFTRQLPARAILYPTRYWLDSHLEEALRQLAPNSRGYYAWPLEFDENAPGPEFLTIPWNSSTLQDYSMQCVAYSVTGDWAVLLRDAS